MTGKSRCYHLETRASKLLHPSNPLLPARDVPPPPPGVRPFVQPTPIILDAQARFPLDCRLFANFKAGVGKRPWVVCDPGMCKRARRIELEEAGCRILVLNTRGTGACPCPR